MKVFGLEKKHLSTIEKIFREVYGDKKNLPETYIFGSRAQGKHRPNSDVDILIKNRVPAGDKLQLLEDKFEDSELPYKVDLVDWFKVLAEYKPSINKSKVLLLGKPDKVKRDPWRLCPIGQHWVRTHDKETSTGKISEWDGHCRVNPSGKEILDRYEIDAISQLPSFKNAQPKVSRETLNFPNGNKYNHLISGWTAYWNRVFNPKKPLHPNIVKALIASESGFNVKSKAKNKLKVGDAQGLVQLTGQTQKILRDRKGELKNHYIKINKGDVWDANKNLAAAVRWLFRKRITARARLKREPTWEEVVFEYKGILMQQNKTAKQIKRDFRKLLKELNE